MERKLEFTALACQTCQAKIHCERCGEDLARSLMQLSDVVSAEVNMKTKILRVTGSIVEDALEAKLEDLGLWI